MECHAIGAIILGARTSSITAVEGYRCATVGERPFSISWTTWDNAPPPRIPLSARTTTDHTVRLIVFGFIGLTKPLTGVMYVATSFEVPQEPCKNCKPLPAWRLQSYAGGSMLV